MRTSRYLAFAAIASLLLTPTVAHAGDPGIAEVNVLTYGSLGGTNVPNGDSLSAGLKSGTTARFMSAAGGTTGITCTASTFAGTVGDNPVAPGTATGTVGTQTFSGCTENIPGVLAVQSIVVDNLPFNVAFDSSTAVVTVTGTIQTTVRLSTLIGTVTCVYRALGGTVTGASSNADNSMSFTDQQFSRFSGPSVCFGNAFWTAGYAPVVDSSQPGSPIVYVN